MLLVHVRHAWEAWEDCRLLVHLRVGCVIRSNVRYVAMAGQSRCHLISPGSQHGGAHQTTTTAAKPVDSVYVTLLFSSLLTTLMPPYCRVSLGTVGISCRLLCHVCHPAAVQI
jgi:hypothetical protein